MWSRSGILDKNCNFYTKIAILIQNYSFVPHDVKVNIQCRLSWLSVSLQSIMNRWDLKNIKEFTKKKYEGSITDPQKVDIGLQIGN